jgi:hypothetical protein
MKKFLSSFKELQKKITYEDFLKLYKATTKTFTGNPFTPPDSIAKVYFNFIKNLKPLFNNNYLSVVVAPRECFKTTTFSIVLPYILIYNSIQNNDDLTTIVLGSYSQERVITAIYKPFQMVLKERFEVITSTERHTIIRYNNKEIAIYPIHINSTLRSCNWKGKRPQVIILDDIDQPAYIQGIKTREYSVARFNGDFLPSIEDGNSFILVAGNKENEISIISDLLKEDKDYVNKLVLPYKLDGKYIKPNWNEKWEERMRKQLGEDFDRLYNHVLPTENYTFHYSNDIVGVKQVYLDFGTQEGSMCAVFFIGRTIVNIIKTDFLGLEKEIIPEILNFKPDYIFFEKNSLQGEVFKHILVPKLSFFKLVPFANYTHKSDRIALAINMLSNGTIKILPELEEDLKKEIQIFKEEGNSHPLDMIGTFIRFNVIANNIKGNITYAKIVN